LRKVGASTAHVVGTAHHAGLLLFVVFKVVEGMKADRSAHALWFVG
jgi:hypothetical protein